MFYSCAKNEAKHYENAKSSMDVSQLDQYLKDFPDAPIGHIDTINSIREYLLDELEQYEQIIQEKNVEVRYELEKEYIANFKVGIHIKEVEQMIPQDERAVEVKRQERWEAIQNMSTEEQIQNNHLEELTLIYVTEKKSYWSGYASFDYGAYLVDSVYIKLNIQDGRAIVIDRFADGVFEELSKADYKKEKETMVFKTINESTGSWKSIYVKRGNNLVYGFDIECKGHEFYTTSDLEMLYTNYFHFSEGDEIGTIKINEVRKKLIKP